MQKLPILKRFQPKFSIPSPMQRIRRTLLGVLLIGTVLDATAQVVPGPTSPAPSQLPAGVPRPGQVPGNARPGQPANTQTPAGRTQPGNTGTNQPGGRTQSGQPNNQPGGRTQQGQPGSQTGGRTAPGQPGTGQAGDASGDNVNRDRRSTADDPFSEMVEDNQQGAQEDAYASIRRRELEEQKRKLFGYEIFNNPNLRATFEPNLRIATPAGYVIGPDDILNVNIYGFSEANYQLTVNPEGNVYIERIGPVFVQGLTIDAARNRLRDRLSKIFVGLKSSSYGPANTYMVVTLGNIRSIRVSVLGEANRPGTYTLSSLATALNAIYESGGPNEIGSYRVVNVIRNNRVISRLDLYDFLTSGVQNNNVRLQDNDVIRFTTFRSRVEIQGTVKRNNIFELLPGESMQRLLELAGGFTSNAYKSRLKVTRFTNRELKVVDVTEADFKSFELQDGDKVSAEQVLDRYENQVNIQGAVFRPGLYSLDQNKTLRQLLQSAEGLRGDAFTGRINLIRTRDDMAVENISLNLANILNGIDPDIELKREDQIIVPSRFEMAEQANVTIRGEINNPINTVPYTANMTLEDLILRAGGLRESAASSQVEVVRRKKDVDPNSTTAQIAEIYRFDVGRDLSINARNTGFILEPFDEVIVRRSPNYREQSYATAQGEVIIPGQYPLRTKDQRISDLVKLAGGLTPYAYVEGATLIRTRVLSQEEQNQRANALVELADDSRKTAVEVNMSDKETIGINLKRILERPGSAEDMLLLEGDVLEIPKRLETVRVQGEVLLPTTVKYRNGQTFQDYISQAGGFTNSSSRKRAYVVYANGSADRTRKFGFFNVYPRVEPGSEIIIPRRTTGDLTPQQVLQQATAVVSSVMTLILAVLAFRNIR